MSQLFADHSDLLKEFTYFLPDAVQEQAKACFCVVHSLYLFFICRNAFHGQLGSQKCVAANVEVVNITLSTMPAADLCQSSAQRMKELGGPQPLAEDQEWPLIQQADYHIWIAILQRRTLNQLCILRLKLKVRLRVVGQSMRFCSLRQVLNNAHTNVTGATQAAQ